MTKNCLNTFIKSFLALSFLILALVVPGSVYAEATVLKRCSSGEDSILFSCRKGKNEVTVFREVKSGSETLRCQEYRRTKGSAFSIKASGCGGARLDFSFNNCSCL